MCSCDIVDDVTPPHRPTHPLIPHRLCIVDTPACPCPLPVPTLETREKDHRFELVNTLDKPVPGMPKMSPIFVAEQKTIRTMIKMRMPSRAAMAGRMVWAMVEYTV